MTGPAAGVGRFRLRLGLLLVVLLGAGVPLAAPAWAHNVLVSTAPADGATVGATPSQVVMTFDQPALAVGTFLKVTGPSGDVAAGAPRLVNDLVEQSLAPGAPAGRYVVAWRVTSADGHPVSGTFAFTSTSAGAGQAVAPTPAPSVTPDRPAGGSSGTPWLWAAGALVVLLGGGVLLALRRRRGPA